MLTLPHRIDSIQWSTWRPTEAATLLFVVRDDSILLIRKKRGLGAGKINGPGGRLEPGETHREAAIREVQEELGVTPTGLNYHGRHRFQFVDGYGLTVHVYLASGCQGQAVETDEAVPLWTPLDAIPYDEMWADDRIWLPIVLGGGSVDARWIFDGDDIVDYAM